MAVTAWIELIAKPGQREQLIALHHALIDKHGGHPDLLGMELYLMEDHPDGLCELAHWRSVEAHQSWRQGVIDTGDADSFLELLAEPSKITYLKKCPQESE